MELEQKGDSDGEFDNPHIPEDYYVGELTGEFETYERDKPAIGLIMFFEITKGEYAGTELPLFAPAKLSVPRDGSDSNPSRLSEQLRNLSDDLHESVLDMLGVKDEVLSGEQRARVSDADDPALDDLQSALRGALSGRKVRFQVEDNRNEDASQVTKLQKLFDES